jgi:hypothetical protein
VDKYVTMNKKNLEQALAALSDALTSQEPESLLNDPLVFVSRLPKRSLSGDHIYQGKILGFSSAGITDQASKEQILIKDDFVRISAVAIGSVEGDLKVTGDITARTLKADVLEVKELKADIKFEKDSNIPFNGANKGLIWTGLKSTKQFIFAAEPDRFFSSETIDVAKGKSFSINGIKIIDDLELGSTIIKSNLREVGRLRGLIVDGSVSINNYLYYNSASDRLGLGTEEPNASFSVAEDAIEVMLGTRDSVRGIVGTFASHSFDLVTDNVTRIGIAANGNIQLGNTKQPPIQVSVHGKLAVKVNMPDPEVDLHVNGAIKFNGKLHKYAATHPISGAYNTGDLVWNTEPKVNNFVGWVCVQAGDPGIWAPFGKIGT